MRHGEWRRGVFHACKLGAEGIKAKVASHAGQSAFLVGLQFV